MGLLPNKIEREQLFNLSRFDLSRSNCWGLFRTEVFNGVLIS